MKWTIEKWKEYKHLRLTAYHSSWYMMERKYLRPWELKELDFIEDEPLDLTRKRGGVSYVPADFLRSSVARLLVDRYVANDL